MNHDQAINERANMDMFREMIEHFAAEKEVIEHVIKMTESKDPDNDNDILERRIKKLDRFISCLENHIQRGV